MAAWLCLLTEVGARDGVREDLEAWARGLGDRQLNRTALWRDEERVGTLLAVDHTLWDEAQKLADPHQGSVRAFGALALAVAPRVIAGDRGRAFVSLAADLGRSALDFDDVTVVGAMKAALGAFLPALGTSLIATTTLTAGPAWFCGALTAFEAPNDRTAAALSRLDVWARIHPVRLLAAERSFFRRMQPPAGPGTQRYSRAGPWPSALVTPLRAPVRGG